MSVRSRGRGRKELSESPGTRCAHRPRPLRPPPPPSPPQPPDRRHPPARPVSRSLLLLATGGRCVGLRGLQPGSSSPCAVGDVPVAPCSS